MRDNYRDSTIDEMLRAFDPYTHSFTTIKELHRLSHDGMVYHVSEKQTGLANAGVFDILLKVPAGVYPHFNRAEISVGAGDVDIVMYEGTTVSADGSAKSVQNVNGNSTRTASTTVSSGPTVTGVGTLRHTLWAPPTGAGVGSSVGLTNLGFGEEWLLKPLTNYLIRITNNSGGAIDFSYEILFYEVDYAA